MVYAIELLIVLGLTFIGFCVFAALIKNVRFQKTLDELVPSEQDEAIINFVKSKDAAARSIQESMLTAKQASKRVRQGKKVLEN